MFKFEDPTVQAAYAKIHAHGLDLLRQNNTIENRYMLLQTALQFIIKRASTIENAKALAAEALSVDAEVPHEDDTQPLNS